MTAVGYTAAMFCVHVPVVPSPENAPKSRMAMPCSLEPSAYVTSNDAEAAVAVDVAER